VRLSHRSAALWTLLAALTPLVLYLWTLCPTVYCGDGGELGLAAATLQISHPPGYPLLTNFGHVWTVILFFLRPILALNILSALFAAVAAAFAYVLLTIITNGITTSRRLINLALATVFALGQTLWSVATNFEVYSLAALLAVLIVVMLIRFYQSKDRRLLLLACYLFGLALCNHLSVGSLGIMLLMAAWFGRKNLSISDWLLGLALIILPLTFYGYLYVRSSFNLVLDWYDPQTLWGLKQHLFAKTYQRYIATPHLRDIIPYFIGLGRLLSHELVLPFTVLSLPGAFLQYRRDRKLAMMLFSIVIVNCGLNFNYLIPDITPYFLPSLMIAIVWIAELLNWLTLPSRIWSGAAVASALAITIITAAGNFARCNISDRYGAEQYAQDLFERVPEGGTLFCGSDNSMFPALYFHYAENYRPDSKVYGHLPTLTRLRDDLGLKTTPGFNKFPELLRYAVAHVEAPLVFAREPMQYVNDFRTIVPTLFSSGLVYYRDSATQVLPKSMHVNWRHPPKLCDQREALLYATYDLVNGEELVKLGDPEGERLWTQAVEIIHAQENYALCNELSTYFISVGDLRLASKTLEQGLELGELRFEQRLRLLETLGSVSFESGDEKKTREIFAQVERMDPNNTVAGYHLLALAAGTGIRSNRLTDAIATYRQMLQLYPQQREVNLQLGKLLLQTGDTVAARAMFDVCIQDNYRVDYIHKLLK
jgi:tetratricopeptide (TPR) repeat protein